MSRWLMAWGAGLATMLLADGLWLGWLMKGFYKQAMGDLFTNDPNLAAAALFYLAYPAGLTLFVISRAWGWADASWASVALWGALLGLFAYGTYDLTNLATLRGWSLPLVLVDMAWGMVASAAACTVGWLASRA